MKFVLNNEILRKAWNNNYEYWYSLKDQKLYSISEIELFDRPELMEQSEYYKSIGFIPFVSVKSEEVMHTFLADLPNKKLSEAIEKSDSNEFVETFWKYYNAYRELSSYDDFETNYVMKKVKMWCEENSIEYKVV